ncbi:MAG: DUF1254 domain-containing protein [Dehalococcoidia bacterium]
MANLPTTEPTPVTADNFCRAESDMYFAMFAKRGAFGRFYHWRELPLEDTGVRPNRDTLYSEAVFDLDAGPVVITVPDPGDRFLSMLVIDEDHFAVMVVYGGGRHILTKEHADTRYVFAAVRILVDPNNPEDIEAVHALQDALTASQPKTGSFEVPNWDQVSQKKVRNALLTLSATLPDLRKGGGSRDEVDPVRHLIATASGWGLNPDKDAIYLSVTPLENDGIQVYTLSVPGAVPVDSFWSISVYDADGHFVKNELDAYTRNSLTATKATDGSVTVQFGGCDGRTPNCLPIAPGWNYMVRLYRPRPEVLDGTWRFPAAQLRR